MRICSMDIGPMGQQKLSSVMIATHASHDQRGGSLQHSMQFHLIAYPYVRHKL